MFTLTSTKAMGIYVSIYVYMGIYSLVNLLGPKNTPPDMPKWSSLRLHGGWASLVAQMVKNLPAIAGDLDSTPGSGRSPGEGNGKPLQYSCLENPMDRKAWRAIVHGVAKSQTRLALSLFTFTYYILQQWTRPIHIALTEVQSTKKRQTIKWQINRPDIFESEVA